LNDKNIQLILRNCLNKLFKLSSSVHIEVSEKEPPCFSNECQSTRDWWLPKLSDYPLYSRLNHQRKKLLRLKQLGFN